MTKNEAVIVLKKIADFYQYFSVSKDKVIEWTKFLIPYEYNFVLQNLENHIKESEYPPTVKDLTQEKVASKNIAYTAFTEETIQERDQQAKDLLKKYGVPEIDHKNVEIPDFLKGRKRGEQNGATNTK